MANEFKIKHGFISGGNADIQGDVSISGSATADNGQRIATRDWSVQYLTDNNYATTADITAAIDNLSDSAPALLNTLNELAAALGDDPNFATTITNSIATKLSLSGGTMTGNITFSDDAEGIVWSRNTDGASIKFYNTADGDTDSRLEFHTNDNNNEFFRWTHGPSGAATYETMKLVPASAGNSVLTVQGTIYEATERVATQTHVSSNYLSKFHDMDLTLSGDVTGTGTFNNMGDLTITTVVANDSHTHDGRYYTETEMDTKLAQRVSTGGDTITGSLNITDGLTAGGEEPYLEYSKIVFDNSHNDVARGPNKIVMHDNGSGWNGGFGIHSSTVAYYTGDKHSWYKSNSNGTFTERMTLDASGNLSIDGQLSASGYNKSDWDTAYTYSQVGHLPLAGGTLTGDLTLGDNQLKFGTNNVAPPSTSDPDTGTRINLYPIGSGRHYAIGIESENMWFNADGGYKWYNDSNNIASLSSSGVLYVNSGNSAQWNTAYSWGNHASAGYASASHTHSADQITGGTLGANGRIALSNHPEAGALLTPSFENDLAYIIDRGGSVSAYITDSTEFTDQDLTNIGNPGFSISTPFNGTTNYSYGSLGSVNDVVVWDIEMPFSLSYGNTWYVDFGAGAWQAKTVTFLAYQTYDNAEENYKVVGSTFNNVYSGLKFTSGSYSNVRASNGTTNYSYNRLRVVMTDWDRTNPRIAAIGAKYYNSQSLAATLLSKGGGSVYGDITATGNITAANLNVSNWDTAFGWGNHAGLYLGATAKAADSNLLDGLDSSAFVRSNADDTITGSLTISGSSPQLKFNDGDSGADDFWIHVNSNRFYILPDRDDNGAWDTPYAFILDNNTSTAEIYGQIAATRDWVSSQGYITSSGSNYYLDGLTFDTGTGILTASVNGTTNQTVDLDGRYLTSETDTLDSVVSRGNTTSYTMTIGPTLTLQADGSANHTASRIWLYSHNDYRGAGTFMTSAESTWYAGTPYTNFTGEYIISRTDVPDNEGTANPANSLFRLNADGNLTLTGSISASGYNSSNWDTAYNWGNHASAGYLTSLPSHNHDSRYYTETEINNFFTAYTPFQTQSDFVNGTLVKTDIDASVSSGDSFLLQVRGKSYRTDESPYDLVLQGYIYNSTFINASAINNGTYFPSPVRILELDGQLCFWWARGSYWNSFEIWVTQVSSGDVRPENRVYSVTDEAEPDVPKKISVEPYHSWSTKDFSGSSVSNWDTAYSWGNHASAGYITSLSGYATTQDVTDAISNLVDAAPGTLDTLNELAAALGDDPNFASTISTNLASKVPLVGEATIRDMKTFETAVTSNEDWENSPISILERDAIGTGGNGSDVYSPNINFHWRSRVSRSIWMDSTGDFHFGEYTAQGVPGNTGAIYVGGGNSDQWNTAYSWGDHAGLYAAASHSHSYLPLSGGTLTGALNAGGGITGLTLSNGISGTNFNITGVNQLEIADPGEGIVFKSGSSGNMTLAVVDDASDNILRFSGIGAALQVGTNTVWHAGNLTNVSQLTNDAGYITDGNTGWNNSYGFITASDSITGNAATATSAGYVTNQGGQLLRHDNRTISPSEINAGYLQFGFTSFQNNNTGGWADFLHLRSYTDSSGGNDNLVMFSKDSIEMRIWQQSYGSAEAYANYRDVAFKDEIPTNNNQLTNGAGYITAVPSSFSTNSITIGSGVTLRESTDRADLLSINSGTGGWGGLQITNNNGDGIWSFMVDGGAAGIYDDQNGDWAVYCIENSYVELRHNGSGKLATNSGGVTVTGTVTATGGNSNNWNTAYGWGDHSTVGYLTSVPRDIANGTTVLDRGVEFHDNGGDLSWAIGANDRGGVGQVGQNALVFRTRQGTRFQVGTSWADEGTEVMTLDDSGNVGIGVPQAEITERLNVQGNLRVTGSIDANGYNALNWDTAYSWGNHASAGYITGYSETDTLATVTARGNSTGTRIDLNASESMRLYGIRGQFTGEYMHLYNKVGIGHPNGWGQGNSDTPNYGLSTYGGARFAYGNGAESIFHGNVLPNADRTLHLGREDLRWQIVFCEILDSAGQHEKNLQNPEGEKSIADYATGTVLVWKGGKNVPCNTEADHMRMGIAVNGIESPLIQGAEPVLVAGPVTEGDYLITSEIEGHAKAISRLEMIERNLQDCVFGKALETADGESHLVKVWINI